MNDAQTAERLRRVEQRLEALARGEGLVFSASGFKLGSMRLREVLPGILETTGIIRLHYGTNAERIASTDYHDGVAWWTSDTHDLYVGNGAAWQRVGGASGAPPGAHASTHQHSGADEVATATPGANVIPKAGADSKLASGFHPSIGSGNLHPEYLTPTEHTAIGDDAPHHTPESGESGTHIHDARYLTDAEVAAAIDADIATHAAAADPHTGYQKESEREAASGYAGLDASSKVIKDPANATATPTASKIPIADGAGKLAAGWGGSASTLATLSAGTLVVQNPANATATPTASKIVIADAGGKVDGWVSAASSTVAGKVELAIASEINTGTDATRANTPDALAGSNFGVRVIGILVSDPGGDAITTGNSKAYVRIPAPMTGMNLIDVEASLSTVSSSGAPAIMVRRSRRSSATARTDADMLSTALTIDASEFDSIDAATPAVVDGANDDVVTGDHIHIDVDAAGTGAKGLFVELRFQLP